MMKITYKIILIIFISSLNAQGQFSDKENDNKRLKWEQIKKKIEAAVERGEIKPDKAKDHYQYYREREMAASNRKKDIVLENNFKRIGIDNLNKLKNELLDQDIALSQLDAVLGGMLRLIYAAKSDKENFGMNPRIEAYFKDRLDLTDAQVKYIIVFANKIAIDGRMD